MCRAERAHTCTTGGKLMRIGSTTKPEPMLYVVMKAYAQRDEYEDEMRSWVSSYWILLLAGEAAVSASRNVNACLPYFLFSRNCLFSLLIYVTFPRLAQEGAQTIKQEGYVS